MKHTEAEIIAMLQDKRSQNKGLRALMDTYQSRLYWHIRRMLVDHSLAEDALQETFIKAYQKIHLFKKDSKLYTWLYRIATNEALQELRKIKSRKITDDEVSNYLINQVAETTMKDADEIQILLNQAIQTLPEKQKMIFNLRYFDDLSHEEIAEIAEISVGTSKTNYHYAKNKIQDYIKQNAEK